MRTEDADPLLDGGNDAFGHPGDDLRERLAASWRDGDWAMFYGTAYQDLAPRIMPQLVAMGLTKEDADDCISDALEELVKRQDSHRQLITNPQAYIRKSAYHAACDMLKDKKCEVRTQSAIADDLRDRERREQSKLNSVQSVALVDEFGPFSERAAIYLTEAILTDIEVHGKWALRVLTIAVGRLAVIRNGPIDWRQRRDHFVAATTTALVNDGPEADGNIHDPILKR